MNQIDQLSQNLILTRLTLVGQILTQRKADPVGSVGDEIDKLVYDINQARYTAIITEGSVVCVVAGKKRVGETGKVERRIPSKFGNGMVSLVNFGSEGQDWIQDSNLKVAD